MPVATYSRVNAGGLNSSHTAGSAPNFSFIDLASSPGPAPQVGQSRGSSNQGVGTMDRPQHRTSAAGFIDPFDELIAFSNQGHASPQIAADSSHGPLGLDPLADLWTDVSPGQDLLLTQPAIPHMGASTAQPTNHHLDDPWSLDMFEIAAPSEHSHQRPSVPGLEQTRSRRGASNNDLLQIHSDDEGPGTGGPIRAHPSHGSHAHGTLAKPASLPDLTAHGAGPQEEVEEGTSSGPPALEEGEGSGSEQRELFIYAIPLSKEKLVFLPITGWQEEPKPPPTGWMPEPPPTLWCGCCVTGVTGSLSAGMTKFQESVSTMWNNMGAKETGTLQHKIHAHGTAIMENMSAEERLMKYIPKAATKVIVYHPASVMPSEVQEQLQKMTSTFMVKATGKAAAAGLLLPVAVGIEMIAVPGTGWYALYQLYKSSVSVKGVSRLNQYLNHATNVRVCYAGMEKLDVYCEKSRLSPDGLLTQDDIDDLCHELEEPGLQHPLTELRTRYAKRAQHKTGEYALLATNDTADSPLEGRGSDGNQGNSSKPVHSKSGSLLSFWK